MDFSIICDITLFHELWTQRTYCSSLRWIVGISNLTCPKLYFLFSLSKPALSIASFLHLCQWQLSASRYWDLDTQNLGIIFKSSPAPYPVHQQNAAGTLKISRLLLLLTLPPATSLVSILITSCLSCCQLFPNWSPPSTFGRLPK